MQMNIAIQIAETTDLGIAMLIAEFNTGEYFPVSAVGNLREAREIAQQHFNDVTRSRAKKPQYRVWARGWKGAYESVAEIDL